MSIEHHTGLNAFERRQLYLQCEESGTHFRKTHEWRVEWVCRDHKRMLVPNPPMGCGDLVCCGRCPDGGRSCSESWRRVKAKLPSVLTFRDSALLKMSNSELLQLLKMSNSELLQLL